jgi:large subunit ribosomal protein L13
MKNEEKQKREWYIIDATDIRLGKLASTIAPLLQGKNKPTYAPNVDKGDFVIVINAKNIDVHQARLERKKYYRHSGYPGGITEQTLGTILKDDPKKLIELAVKGMMPQTKLGKVMLKKLHVYNEEKHPHEAQKPIEFKVK